MKTMLDISELEIELLEEMEDTVLEEVEKFKLNFIS